MSGRDPDAAEIGRAVAAAAGVCRDAVRASPGFSFPEPWLDRQVKAVTYATPTGADGAGFATAGAVRNLTWGKQGIVLLHQETGEVRMVWIADG